MKFASALVASAMAASTLGMVIIVDDDVRVLGTTMDKTHASQSLNSAANAPPQVRPNWEAYHRSVAPMHQAEVDRSQPNWEALHKPTYSDEAAVDTHNGIATYYDQMGGYGSCGNKNPDTSKIAALSTVYMKDKKTYCGKYVQVTNTGGGLGNTGKGKSVTVKVQDTCPGCDKDHLDLSHGAFQALTGGKLDPPGKINISWKFVSAPKVQGATSRYAEEEVRMNGEEHFAEVGWDL